MPAGYLEGGLSTFTAFLVARLPEPQRGMCHVFKMISNNTISFYLSVFARQMWLTVYEVPALV